MEILKILRKKTSDKAFRDKAFNIAKKPKYDRYQRVIAFMVHNFFIKQQQVVLLKMRIC